MTYPRKTTKWCNKHPGRDDCDCPSVEVKVPSTYADLATGTWEQPAGPILAIGEEGTEFIDAEEYRRRTGQDWAD